MASWMVKHQMLYPYLDSCKDPLHVIELGGLTHDRFDAYAKVSFKSAVQSKNAVCAFIKHSRYFH